MPIAPSNKLLHRLKMIPAIILGLYVFLAAALFIAGRFVQFRESDEEVNQYYIERQLGINIAYYPCLDRNMRYVYTDDDPTKPTILFIHGAPSSSSYYRHFLSNTDLREKANLIAVDRAGYGYSGFGQPVPELEKQAYMIRPILDSLHRNNHPVLVVAASYGTSIASRLAMDYPHLVDGLLLLAPSLAPGEEKTYDISYVLESPFFSWVQPGMLHSANIEKFSHKEELNKMLPLWSTIEQPVQYYQGQNDELIYTSNAGFAKKQLINALSLKIQMIPNRGHLIVHDEEERIESAINEMIQQSSNYYASRKLPPYQWQASKKEVSNVTSD